MHRNLDLKVRSAVRRTCRLFGRVRYLNKETAGRIVDLSTAGIAVDLAGPFHGAKGSRIAIECEDLGTVEGTIRWVRDGRIGVEFSRTSNAAAVVASYFRFFYKEITPVLKR